MSTALVIFWAHYDLSYIGLHRALLEGVFQWSMRNRRELILYLAPKILIAGFILELIDSASGLCQ